MNPGSSIPVLSQWEKFVRTHPSGSVEDFARWILKNEKEPPPVKAVSGHKRATGEEIDRAARAGLLINRLYKLLGFFNKPIIRNMGLVKEHEFAVFAQLAISEKPNKKELAKETLIEVSTTVEITKRLVKKGLIKEEVDKTDRRAARISLTEKGRKLLMHHAPFFTVHLKEFLKSISEDEQRKLIDLLEKLNTSNSNRFELEKEPG